MDRTGYLLCIVIGLAGFPPALSLQTEQKCGCSPELQATVYRLQQQIRYLQYQLVENCHTCPDGYYLLGDRCYRVYRDRLGWLEASANCSQDGAQLVSFQTEEEEEMVRQHIAQLFADTPYRPRFYTSGNELDEKFVWKWGTGEDAEEIREYENWATGEPNDHQGEDESCLEFHLGEGWNDVPCYLDMSWICEREPIIPWMDRDIEGEINPGLTDEIIPYWKEAKLYRKYNSHVDKLDDTEVILIDGEDEGMNEEGDGQMEGGNEENDGEEGTNERNEEVEQNAGDGENDGAKDGGMETAMEGEIENQNTDGQNEGTNEEAEGNNNNREGDSFTVSMES